MRGRSAICTTIVSALLSFGARADDTAQLFDLQGPSRSFASDGVGLLSNLRGPQNPAMNYPYYWAWHLFTEVNSPSSAGIFNGWRRFTGGRTVKWENWASDTETFPTCPDADNPPTWPGKTARTKILGARLQTRILSEDAVDIDWYTLDDNGNPTSVSVSDPQEVRRNRASFDYIVDNGLYYTEGLADAFADAEAAVEAAGGGTAQSMAAVQDTVKFPIDAIEIKADWIPIANIPEDERKDYYTNWAVGESDDTATLQQYALVAMHIMTKDVPNWFWATWMNKNVLGRCDYYGCRDDFGIDPGYTAPNDSANYPYDSGVVTARLETMMKMKRLDKVFRNYRLVGVQTDFVDPTGNPTLMSNTITEQYQLQTASCITCHSRAAVDSTGATLSVLSATALAEIPPTGDSFATDNGIPDPTWFWNLDDGGYPYFTSNTKVTELVALQIDFVWGILNANSVDSDSCTTTDE